VYIVKKPDTIALSNQQTKEIKIMTKFTKQLQNIIMGYSYNEAIIDEAITLADDFETKVLLKAFKGGHYSFEMRMKLSDFVCRLDQNNSNKTS
jgi:cell division protein YceG involved in septum cleavage